MALNNKLKLMLVLFIIGFAGVVSLLMLPLPADKLPPEVTALFTKTQIRLLSLVNPTIFLLAAVLVGANVYKQVNLSAPLIEKAITGVRSDIGIGQILRSGSVSGMVAGLVLISISALAALALKAELGQLSSDAQFPLVVRLLYGGVTEEILLRFGLMSAIVWLIRRMTGKLVNSTFYAGIILSALLFGVLHLPVVFVTLGQPSVLMILYIILANALGGLIFGWIYWKKGLEAAFISHMTAHLVIVAVNMAG